MPSTLGLPSRSHSTNIQASAAAAVAIWVTAMAIPARPLAASAEPALKPNQPTQSSEAPITLKVDCAAPCSRRHSRAACRHAAATRPAMPKLMCTTVPPAKSRAPRPPIQPRPHTQCAIGAYTTAPEAHEPKQRRELHPVGEGAADQRRGDDREGRLKGHETLLGIVPLTCPRPCRGRNRRDKSGRGTSFAGETRLCAGQPSEPSRRQRRCPPHGHRGSLLAHHAAVEHRGTGNGHHQDQRGRGQHPGGVAESSAAAPARARRRWRRARPSAPPAAARSVRARCAAAASSSPRVVLDIVNLP